MGKSEEVVRTFTNESLPDLDTVTLGALELFTHTDVPDVDFLQFKRPLVVGSGNAAVTGRLLFDDVDAIFADETSYVQKLSVIDSIDGAFLLSASGGKHAIEIAQFLAEKNIPTILLTNNESAPAKAFLPESNVYVFPKNREPYTYNTSTYMGMLLSKTCENPDTLITHIAEVVDPLIPTNFASYEAFYFMVPEHFTDVRELFKTKFDELFGPKLMARIFTFEQTKHAKTVIGSQDELFVSFGVENTLFGNEKNRLHIPLPHDCDYVALMAIGYYFIGHIQKQLPPYYKERIAGYIEETSTAFGSKMNVIVE